MPSPLDPPNWDAYHLPILPAGIDLPAGNFLLPVCTTKERLTALLTALDEFQPYLGQADPQRKDLTHLIDVMEALHHIDECVVCGEVAMPDDCAGCTEYAPDQRLIEWQPNDPFRTPNLVPTGYHLPPWSVNDAGVVKTDLLDLPTDFLDILLSLDFAGFPRFKVRFSGAGKVQLHLEQIPLGGLALITVDGNPLSTEIVDLSSLDLLALADFLTVLETLTNDDIEGGLHALRIVEINLSEPGDHYIDVTLLPKISSDNILGFGGGFRKVALCGQAITGELPPETAPQLRQTVTCIEWLNPATQAWECVLPIQKTVCPDCGELVEECEECQAMACSKCSENGVRFCNGRLEYKAADGTWQPVPASTITDVNAPVETPGELPTSGNVCWKALGVWSVLEKTGDAILNESAGSGTTFGAYNGLQNNYAGLNFDNLQLFQLLTYLFTDLSDAEIEDLQTEWQTQKVFLQQTFICGMLNAMGNSGVLTDAEIGKVRDFDWGFDGALQDFLEQLGDVPESLWLKQQARISVQDGKGVCECEGISINPGGNQEIEWEQHFAFAAASEAFGFTGYSTACGTHPNPTDSFSGLQAKVSSHAITCSTAVRRGLYIQKALVDGDNTTRILNAEARWAGVTDSTESNVVEGKRGLWIAFNEGAAYGLPDLESHGGHGIVGLGSGSRQFSYSDNLRVVAGNVIKVYFQIGQRNDGSVETVNGDGYLTDLFIRGKGTNPFA